MGDKGVHLIDWNTNFELVSSIDRPITKTGTLVDALVDEAGDFWVSIFDCSVERLL